MKQFIPSLQEELIHWEYTILLIIWEKVLNNNLQGKSDVIYTVSKTKKEKCKCQYSYLKIQQCLFRDIITEISDRPSKADVKRGILKEK